MVAFFHQHGEALKGCSRNEAQHGRAQAHLLVIEQVCASEFLTNGQFHVYEITGGGK